jgi:hypothetical protein
MSNPGFTKTYSAGEAIPARHIIKPSGINEGEVVLASASSDALMGISSIVDTAQSFNVEVVHSQSAEVVLGDDVQFGDPITSDVAGCGVKSAPATGMRERIIGFALRGGVLNEVVPVLIQPGFIQG